MSVVYILVPKYIINREDNSKRRYCINVKEVIILIITILDVHLGWLLGIG